MISNGLPLRRTSRSIRLLMMAACLASVAMWAADSTAAEARTWSSAKGSFKIEATFVRLETNAKGQAVVVIETKKGKQLPVVLDVLSEADRKYVERLQKRDADSKAKDGDAGDDKADDDAAKTREPTEQPGDPSLDKGSFEKLLAGRKLVRRGGFWMVRDEERLDALLIKALGTLDALEKSESAFSEREHKAAKKIVHDLARRTHAMTAFDQVHLNLHDMYPEVKKRRLELDKYTRSVRKKIRAVTESELATARVRDKLAEILREMDPLMAAVESRYQILANDPEVYAAIKQLGGELGPRDTWDAVRSEFHKMADKYLATTELLSRSIEVMNCGVAPSSPFLPNAEQSPEAFLKALGLVFNDRKKEWNLSCELHMIQDVQNATECLARRKQLEKSMSKSQRAKIARAMRDSQEELQQLTQEYNTKVRPNNVTKRDKFRPWKKRKLKHSARAFEIQEQQKLVREVLSHATRLKDHSQMLLKRACEKGSRIRARYDELLQNEKVIGALEEVGGELEPSGDFDRRRSKAEMALKKMTKGGKR